MDPNPYSAPKAPVADPILVPLERPRVVTRAVHLLWISLLIGIAGALAGLDEVAPDLGSRIAVLVFDGVWLGINAWLIFKLARGRRWARTTYVLVAAFSYVVLAYSWPEAMKRMQDEPYELVTMIAGIVTELVALYLLFTKASSAWFAQPTRPAQS
jgi:hypothetical protein